LYNEKPISVFIVWRAGVIRNPFLILCALFFQAFPAYHALSADTLNKWISSGPPFSFILIDVRDTSEVDTVMGTSACRPYHMSLNQGVFAASYSLIPKTSNVILYCRSGGRSGQAAAILDAAGYTSVYAMSSGFSTWIGPKQPRANLLPLSDLPKNSMTAGSSVILPTTAGFRKTQARPCASHGIAGNRYRIALVNPNNGSTQYFDAKGKIHFSAQKKGLP
jgi:rhodanese-related sulfurtransferase